MPLTTMTPKEQVHYKILNAIEKNPEISQRELARQVGVSTGKAHYLMVALIEKGLLKVGSFSRNDGKLGKVTYLLTPEGVKNRVALTRDYLARKEAEYEALWCEIKALRHEGRELTDEATATRQGAPLKNTTAGASK
jgi:EPS-associated MarR family transcriptional regulator